MKTTSAMKTERTPRQRVKRMALGGLPAAVLALALVAAVTCADDPEPEVPTAPEIPGVGIVGQSHESAASRNEPLIGSAAVTIDGVTYPAATVSEPLAVAELPGNFGSYAATTAHTFDLAEGNTLRTMDEEFLMPVAPGAFLVTGTLNIVGGTGRYMTARGYLDVYGLIGLDQNSVSAMLTFEGRIDY